MTEHAALDVAILGAGPTGIGAARRLVEIGRARPDRPPTWRLFEAGGAAGGLSASVTDDAGFRWDLGGHVLYSHYEYFDALLDEVIDPDDWIEQPRRTFVSIAGRWLPYPIQRNVHRLPPDLLLACLRGLLDVHRAGPPSAPPANFAAWCRQNFGDGLHAVFFEPFNLKMWAHPLESMSAAWTGGRSGSRGSNVPLVDLARVLECVVLQRDDPGFVAQTFRYPRSGGTGAIWQRAFERLPRGHVEMDARAVRIDPRARRIDFANGRSAHYRHVVSGLPLDQLVAMIDGADDLRDAARALAATSTHVVGLGFDGTIPDALADKHWIYLADREVPAYRATVLSNYSAHVVPHPGRQWSLLLETSESPHRPVDAATIARECLDALRATGIVPPDARPASTWTRRLPRGYPVPLLGRDDVLDLVQSRLLEWGIASRGRLGGWRYEVSNQDHSCLQGVEAVDAFLLGVPETTYPDPASVDAKVPGLRPVG